LCCQIVEDTRIKPHSDTKIVETDKHCYVQTSCIAFSRCPFVGPSVCPSRAGILSKWFEKFSSPAPEKNCVVRNYKDRLQNRQDMSRKRREIGQRC